MYFGGLALERVEGNQPTLKEHAPCKKIRELVEKVGGGRVPGPGIVAAGHIAAAAGSVPDLGLHGSGYGVKG